MPLIIVKVIYAHYRKVQKDGEIKISHSSTLSKLTTLTPWCMWFHFSTHIYINKNSIVLFVLLCSLCFLLWMYRKQLSTADKDISPTLFLMTGRLFYCLNILWFIFLIPYCWNFWLPSMFMIINSAAKNPLVTSFHNPSLFSYDKLLEWNVHFRIFSHWQMPYPIAFNLGCFHSFPCSHYSINRCHW